MIEKDLSIGIIVQHNVPDFICWKYEESPLLTVYPHCDRVIVIVLIQLHSDPLSPTMTAIIVIISDPFEPFESDDECDCYILYFSY